MAPPKFKGGMGLQGKRTRPPPKETLLGDFSGLKENLFQIVFRYENPMKTRKTISTSEVFPPWPPHFFLAKKSSALEQGGVCFLFPSHLGNGCGILFRECFLEDRNSEPKMCHKSFLDKTLSAGNSLINLVRRRLLN